MQSIIENYFDNKIDNGTEIKSILNLFVDALNTGKIRSAEQDQNGN
jgi:hypothetical protein